MEKHHQSQQIEPLAESEQPLVEEPVEPVDIQPSLVQPSLEEDPVDGTQENSSAIRRVRLIMNPVSGDDQPNLMKLPDIIAAMEAAGIRADLAFTSPDESPTCIAQRAVAEGYDMVVVGGGDGTVAEVAKGLIQTPVPLGILPIGTYNNIARSLNLPTDIAEACQVLAQGKIQQIDVGQANQEHYFFEAAGVGLDAALFPLGEAIKGGRWGRMLQATRLAMGYQPQRLRISFDRPITEARQMTGKKRSPRKKRFSRQGANHLRLAALLVVIAQRVRHDRQGVTAQP